MAKPTFIALKDSNRNSATGPCMCWLNVEDISIIIQRDSREEKYTITLRSDPEREIKVEGKWAEAVAKLLPK